MTEAYVETQFYDFRVDMDSTSSRTFRVSFDGAVKKVKEETIHSGEARWITHAELPSSISLRVFKGMFKVSTLIETSFVEDKEKGWLLSKNSGISDFENYLASLEKMGLLKRKDFVEIMKQRKILEEKRETLSKYKGKVVVVCGGEIFVGDTLDEAVEKAKAKHKNKPFYSESIGIIDFPSVYEL
ncbi:MAG: hypothetical protein Q6352_016330 [Candidatus Freyrarchaeum guaymaensis]